MKWIESATSHVIQPNLQYSIKDSILLFSIASAHSKLQL